LIKQNKKSWDNFGKISVACQNDVFRKYFAVLNSLKELSWENPEIKKLLDSRHDDEVSKHMDYLIAEFKDIKKREKINQENATV